MLIRVTPASLSWASEIGVPDKPITTFMGPFTSFTNSLIMAILLMPGTNRQSAPASWYRFTRLTDSANAFG